MKRTVTAVEARRNLGELLEQVYYRGDEIVIERAGKPMATLVRPDSAASSDLAWIRDWMRENAERNKELTEDEVERLVTEEVKAVRAAAAKKERGKSA